MRRIHNPQLILGERHIPDINMNLKSRDDIPVILLGLQYIYATPEIKEHVFKVLKKILPDSKKNPSQKANPKMGSSGMDQWNILVLGTLRLGLNTDYDRIHDLSNNHNLIRQMLGHGKDNLGEKENPTEYSLQTIKDNLKFFTPETLCEINQIVVSAGHTLVKKRQKIGKLKNLCHFVVVVTPLWWRQTFTFQRISLCSTIRFVKQLKRVRIFQNVTI